MLVLSEKKTDDLIEGIPVYIPHPRRVRVAGSWDRRFLGIGVDSDSL